MAQWWWRFFGSRGKKTTGGSVLNVSPPSDGLTKRRKCFSAAAGSSGLAPVQDRANVVKAARRQRAFTWLFGLLHSKACLCICARLIMRHLDIRFCLFRCSLIVRVQPTVLTSRAAKLRPVLCLLRSKSCTRHHADSFCRRVTRVLSVNAAEGSDLGVRDSIRNSGVPTSLRMSPARTRICQRLRRALIRS